MRKGLLIGILVGIASGIDLKNPASTPEGQMGKQWGETIKNQYGGKGNINKLTDPPTKPQTPYTMPKGNTFYAGSPFCGQGDVQGKTVFASVSVSGNTVYFRWASNPKSGNLDMSASFSGTYLCPAGYCSSWDGTKYTGCYKYTLTSGGLTWQSVDTLDGCTDPSKQPQLPTFYGGEFLKQLLDLYKSTGKEITYSDHKVQDNTVSYYGGELKNCQDVKKNPPQTAYLSNPYSMPDQALYQYFTCDINNDPSCKALHAFVEGTSTGESTAVCVIQRDVNPTPNTISRTDQRICMPGAKLYPDGYNDSSRACFSGDRFFDFSSFFWLECNPDGRGYTLKGFGYWEGAPCGQKTDFPPKPQIEVPYLLDQSIDWTQVGRLSVNRRRGGEGLSDGDKVSPQDLDCVSNDPTPYTVWIKNTFTSSPANNVLEIKIDNAPACNYFKFSRVQGLVGETTGDCSDYEKQGCKVVNEWWTDANGNTYQVIKNGNPVQMLTGCTEILRDESQKVWTSQVQTPQAPPQNCNWPPKTCKTINGQVECRQWWAKRREYKCATTKGSDVKIDLTRQANAVASVDYNPDTGELKYRDDPSQNCSQSGVCSPITTTETRFRCSVDGKDYVSSSLCTGNCFQTFACNQNAYAYLCSKTGQQYPDQNTCQQNCREPMPCNTVYICPTNSQQYSDQSSCLSGCNNCQKQGTCQQTQRYVCSATGQEFTDSSQCQSSCSQTGSCNQEYYCTQGTLSGQNCAVSPTLNCPSGYTASGGICTANPQCPSGTGYNSSTDRCETNPTCPAGYTWNSTVKACVTAPTCSYSGYTWDSSLKTCRANASCPSPGTLNPSRDKCETSATCPSGYTYNSSRNRCEASPQKVCNMSSVSCVWNVPGYGSYSVPLTSSSPSYWSGNTNYYIGGYNVNFYCSVSSSSSSGGAVSAYGQYYITNTGETSYNYGSGSCNSTFYFYVWSPALNQYVPVTISNSGSLVNTCPSGGTFDATNNVCYTGATSCPSGYTYNSSYGICQANPTCPSGGSYNTGLDLCTSSYYSCPSGSTYDSTIGMCKTASVSCPSGTTYDSTNKVCYAGATCPSGGSLNTSTDRCEAQGSLSCPSGFTLSGNQCVAPAQTRYRCSLNGQTYSDQSSCQSACTTQGTCSAVNRYSCSLNGSVYQDQSSCQSACVENIPNCCQAQGLCTGDNRLYPADTCSSQCFKPAQCSPLYNYICSMDSTVFSSNTDCQNYCKQQRPCSLEQVSVTQYMCSLTLLKYETPESCQSACSSGMNCTPQDRSAVVGTAQGGLEEDSKCTSAEARYCVVKLLNSSPPPKYIFDTKECIKSGDTYTCPLGGGVLVEDCRCSAQSSAGFGIAGGTLNIIYQALHDRSCGQ